MSVKVVHVATFHHVSLLKTSLCHIGQMSSFFFGFSSLSIFSSLMKLYRCEFISLVKVIVVVCVCDENKEQSLVEQTIARGLRVESTLNTRRIDRVLCWWHGVGSAARSETSSLRDEWVKGRQQKKKETRRKRKRGSKNKKKKKKDNE